MGERGGAGEGVRTVAAKREDSGTFCSATGVEQDCSGSLFLNPKSGNKEIISVCCGDLYS